MGEWQILDALLSASEHCVRGVRPKKTGPKARWSEIRGVAWRVGPGFPASCSRRLARGPVYTRCGSGTACGFLFQLLIGVLWGTGYRFRLSQRRAIVRSARVGCGCVVRPSAAAPVRLSSRFDYRDCVNGAANAATRSCPSLARMWAATHAPTLTMAAPSRRTTPSISGASA